MASRGITRRFAAIMTAVALTGCAAAPQSERLSRGGPALLMPAIELKEIPFFPQQRYQCGPAALATALAAGGAPISPEALSPQLFLPQRKGTLQWEMVAATRRQGYLPYVLAPSLEDLLAEVQAGHPVIVLQNLALSWYPRWHYAVVIGYNLRTREIIMRSGTVRRHVIALDRFERTWARSGYWAMVALSPDHLPVTADERTFLGSVADLEVLGNARAAHTAYAAALARWPESTLAWMGLGNTAYALNRYTASEAAFRRVLELDPDYAPAINNLAQLLSERGAVAEAEALARRAIEVDGGRMPVYAQTLAEIRRRIATSHGGTQSADRSGAKVFR